MQRWRPISTDIWDDPRVVTLSPAAKLLLIYLRTNRHGHLTGIYLLAAVTIAHELGSMPTDAVESTLKELADAKLIRRGRRDLIWVIDVFGDTAPGEKLLRAASNHLPTLHDPVIVGEFLEKYPDVKRYLPDGPADGVSQAHSGAGSRKCTDTETETKTETEIKPAAQASGEAAPRPSPAVDSSPVILIFPTIAAKKTHSTEWRLHQSYIDELAAAFTAVDVVAECRKALLWVNAKPANKKTAGGMREFLMRWMSNQQNRGGNRGANGKAANNRIDERGLYPEEQRPMPKL
jgi:hypothetical protein